MMSVALHSCHHLNLLCRLICFVLFIKNDFDTNDLMYVLSIGTILHCSKNVYKIPALSQIFYLQLATVVLII